jgi:hypothetical protein
MKKLGLAVAFVLVAFAVPVSAIPVLIPYCSAVRGSCSPGSTTSCTDACGNHLSCTCSSGSWWCDQEC